MYNYNVEFVLEAMVMITHVSFDEPDLPDDFIIQEFNIKSSELPWLNSTHKDKEEDWTNFFVYLRLAIARIIDQGFTHKRKLKILN